MVPSTWTPGTRLGLGSLWPVSICINLFVLPSGTSCPPAFISLQQREGFQARTL